MDAVNNLRTDTTTPTVLPTQGLGDFDTLTFEQMGLSLGWWELPVPPSSSAPVRGRRGGGRNGSRGRGGSGSVEGRTTREGSPLLWQDVGGLGGLQ